MSDPVVERIVSQPCIADSLAAHLANAVVHHASEIGQRSVVAVVDTTGTLKHLRRMDGSTVMGVEISQNKAYTAAAHGLPTHAWYEMIREDPPLSHGIVHTPRLVIFGGGYPIYVDGVLVGGLGVSGGHYSEDMKVAEAALAATGIAWDPTARG